MIKDLDDIYTKKIIELASSLPPETTLDSPDGSAVSYSRLCGSSVRVDLTLTNCELSNSRVIDKLAMDVNACVFGQAASVLLARYVLGKNIDQLSNIKQVVEDILKKEADPPGNIVDFEVLKLASPHKNRHASIMLPFQAACQAMDEAISKYSKSNLSSAPDN